MAASKIYNDAIAQVYGHQAQKLKRPRLYAA